MRKLDRAFHSQRRGNYMMTMGALLPIIMGFAALSVDISYIQMCNSQTQHVADAASHAAFVAFRATNDTSFGDSAAQYIVDTNIVGDGNATLDRVQYGLWDFDNQTFDGGSSFLNSAKADVSRNGGNAVDLFFARLPLIGKDKHDTAAAGTTAGRTRQIMLVQDVSCSFSDDIHNARDANIAFIDYIAGNPYPGDMIGMTLFGGNVWYPVYEKLDYVTTNYLPMRSHLTSLRHCDRLPAADRPSNASCWTSQFRGLRQARDQFVINGDAKEFQAVIMVSDGVPTCNWSQCGGSYTAQGRVLTEVEIDDLWDNENVHVWTVTFQNGGGNWAWMQTLSRGMGTSYLTPDPTELEGIMLEIAASIPVVLTE